MREPKRKCPKAVPTHLQYHVVWSRTLKYSVRPYVTGPLTKCYFNERLFMRVLTHDNIQQINGCERSECHGLPIVVWGLPPRGGCWKQSKWPWNMIHWMPYRNPRRLYIHITSTYSVGPSSIVWTKLGPAPPFPPTGVLDFVVVTGTQSHPRSGPYRSNNLKTANWDWHLLNFQLQVFVTPQWESALEGQLPATVVRSLLLLLLYLNHRDSWQSTSGADFESLKFECRQRALVKRVLIS